MSELMSYGGYARSRSVTRPYISRLVAQGVLAEAIVPDKQGRPWIDRERADAILAKRADLGRRAGNRERKARGAAAGEAFHGDAPATPDRQPLARLDLEWQERRAEALRIENERRRVKLERERDSVVDRAVIVRAMHEFGAGFGKLIERYPDRIVGRVAAQLGVDAHACRGVLVAMGKELRDEFATLIATLPERVGATEQ